MGWNDRDDLDSFLERGDRISILVCVFCLILSSSIVLLPCFFLHLLSSFSYTHTNTNTKPRPKPPSRASTSTHPSYPPIAPPRRHPRSRARGPTARPPTARPRHHQASRGGGARPTGGRVGTKWRTSGGARVGSCRAPRAIRQLLWSRSRPIRLPLRGRARLAWRQTRPRTPWAGKGTRRAPAYVG